MYPGDLDPESIGVPARHRQGPGRQVGADHLEIRALALEAQRDGPRARAEVKHLGASRERKGRLDERLGMGARDEHARVDAEL